jgi:hypothetical protein
MRRRVSREQLLDASQSILSPRGNPRCSGGCWLYAADACWLELSRVLCVAMRSRLVVRAFLVFGANGQCS